MVIKMNYRALEDLINILVKKAGYQIGEVKTLEDVDILTARRGYLSKQIDEIKNILATEDYIDKDDKNKDLEEKKYLEDSLNILKNQMDEGELTASELENLEDQIKFISLKIENKEYFDKSSKLIDEKELEALSQELEETSKIIEDKRKVPSELGAILLDAFKEGKSLKDVQETFDLLVEKATDSYNKTVDEIEDTNIFELMESYSKKKHEVYKKLEKNNYEDKDAKDALSKKSEYHTKKINSYKETMSAISTRKLELQKLIDETKKLYNETLSDRLDKEEKLNKYTKSLNNSINLTNYKDDFDKYLNYLREEILDNKYLEDKYNNDIQSYKEEIRNLEINDKNLNALILNEEKCLDIVDKKQEELTENYNEKIEDEITYLYDSSRLESLSNEQQCFYVSIDVLKNEIINLWSKGDNSDEIEEDYEVGDTEEESMYDNETPVIDINKDDVEDERVETVEEMPSEEKAVEVLDETPQASNEETESAEVEFIDSLE